MKNVFKALAAFQQEVPVIHKGTQGYGYTYADLPAIFEVINPLLKKHGLAFTQPITDCGVHTTLFHIESGETIESCTPIPSGVQLKGMNDFQVLGSAITYIRRYALSSILGIVTDKDIDAAGEQKQQEHKEPATKPTPKQTKPETISKESKDAIMKLLYTSTLTISERAKIAESVSNGMTSDRVEKCIDYLKQNQK